MHRPQPATVLSATALVVAIFGATPVGEAARNAIPPFARNADKVDGIHASKTPKVGYLLALGKNRKFPATVVPAGPLGPSGPPGPKGDKGDAGPQGVPGASELSAVTVSSASNSNATKSLGVSCPAGKRAVGGGVRTPAAPMAVVASFPAFNNGQPVGWIGEGLETSAFAGNWSITTYVICLKIAD